MNNYSNKAVQKYLKSHPDKAAEIRFRTSPERKAQIEEHIRKYGYVGNETAPGKHKGEIASFINQAIDRQIQYDIENKKPIE